MTTVATLAVAAVALLGPLEHSLRHAEQTTLRKDLSASAIRGFSRLDLSNIQTSKSEQAALDSAQQKLSTRIGGTVTVLGNPGPDGEGSRPLLKQHTPDDDSFSDVGEAFRTDSRHYSFGTIDGTQNARAAVPFDSGPAPTTFLYVLAVRKPIDEITSAVSARPQRVHHSGARRPGADADPRDPTVGAARSSPAEVARGGAGARAGGPGGRDAGRSRAR